MLNFSIPPDERKDMRYRLLVTWFIAAILTIILSASGFVSVIDQAIYSFAIGTLMWFFIDVGDLLIFKSAGSRFPFSKNRYLFAAVVIVVANYCGFWIGDWLTVWDILTTNQTQVWTWAFLELVIASISCWFFLQQHRQKQDRISTNETRMRLLESQLEPHMLFNTLANLRALVSSDPVMATKMLDRIVNYLRANLSGSRITMHSLSEEFERLDDYLDIMKMRMGTRLSYSLYLEPELAHQLVPPFILQPLVENAIKHGLEPKVEGGRIFIKAAIDDGKVVLEVNDTGLGVHKDDLLKSNGFGWTQVTERLVATYGQYATINLIATEAYKTSAKITFPFKKMSIAQ
jgi:sensor histidine kinase YesM